MIDIFNYALGPTTLQLEDNVLSHQSRLACFWANFFHMSVIKSPRTSDFFIRSLPPECSLSPPPIAVELPSSTLVKIWQTASSFFVRHHSACFCIDWKSALTKGSLAPDFWDYPLGQQREFFHALFFLLLRQQGIHLQHANGVFVPRHGPARGVLLIGDSGAGKTTLALSLLHAGWGHVGDDTVMLHRSGSDTVDAYAFRRGFACTQEISNLWPELAMRADRVFPLGRRKTWLDLQSLYLDRFAPVCQPRLLLFLNTANQFHSHLLPLDIGQTFRELLCQPGVLLERSKGPAILALYQILVRQARGFKLELGRDVLDCPDHVAALLEAALLGNA